VGVLLNPAARRDFCCRSQRSGCIESPLGRSRHTGNARSGRVKLSLSCKSPHHHCARGADATNTDLHSATTPNIVDLDRVRPPNASADLTLKSTRSSMSFCSILFELPEDRIGDDSLEPPAFFADLNCHQIVDAVTVGKDEYNLKSFFYGCLRRVDAIKYRHEVIEDLAHPSLLDRVTTFARKMRDMREHLSKSDNFFYQEQKQAWFLDAVEIYCDAVSLLADDLHNADLKSRGFLRFRDYLARYVRSGPFTSLLSTTKDLKADLTTVQYCVLIKNGSFTVRKFESESDYSVDVEDTFQKFKQGAVKDYRVKFATSEDMNHIEGKILEFVAKLHSEIFLSLGEYCRRNGNYLDETIAVFDREVQFYVAYLDYISVLTRTGLQFCYPEMSSNNKEIYDRDGFDVVLAHKLVNENASVVCNDFYLKIKERILVISGPNQGGKTTFARAFGQLHYLASIGCPVPGSDAQLFLFDKLFTHFEKEEKVENLRGKLEDDLVRIRDILDQATSRSILIMNEIFTSTTLKDEIFLSTKLMEKVIDLDLLCVWVTFVDELASHGPQTVSMVSTVVPEDPALRTFKIVRRPADGLAYAMAIAQKHRLTYEAIIERVRS
jgi:DNA mismatch repair protein MutS